MARPYVWPDEDDAAPKSVGSVLTEEPTAEVDPLSQYADDPIGFFLTVLEIPEATLRWSVNAGYKKHGWDGTRDPLILIAESLRDGLDVGVESATGTGKSFFAAALVLWFLACWRGARVFSFAPKEDQLRLFIWKELSKLWPCFQREFPKAELTDLRVRMVPGSDEWGAWGYAVGVRAGEQSATRAQGMHAEDMLLIYEETPGIPLSVLEAGENTCTAPHNLRLALGNPDHQLDPLHRFSTSPGVVAVRISAHDHPNIVTGRQVVPGAVGLKSVARRLELYGVDSPKYKSRVRGLSPEESVDALIRKVWIDAAVERWHKAMAQKRSGAQLPGLRAKGVDVARSENGDHAAIADFVGAIAVSVESFPCPDVVKLGRRVFDEMQAQQVAPENVGVDVVGVGGGTVDTINGLVPRGQLVRSLNGAGRVYGYLFEVDGTPHVDARETAMQFGNHRAQMWWQLRYDLQFGAIAIPDDADLIEELLAVKSEERNGKTFIQDKDEIRVTLGRSPNKADALVYGNFVRNRDKHRPVEPREEPWREGRDQFRIIPFDAQHPDPNAEPDEIIGGLGRGW